MTARHERGSPAAFAVSLLFAVQMLLASWAAAGVGDPPKVDVFGNPLCITSTDGNSSPGEDHRELPACCKIGCSAFPGLVVAAAGTAALLPRPSRKGSFPPPRPADIVAEPENAPGSPRAPPLTI